MKNTRKIISVLLSILMIITSVPLMAVESFAAVPVKSGTTGECTWTLDGTVLTISGNGKMEDYNRDKALPWGTKIKKVVIENGVTSIGKEAFRNCTSLTSVTIGNGVTSIGNWAFSGCTSLTSITIPDSVTEIKDGAFRNCTSLESVTIPDSVTEIEEYAFSDCTSLTSITIPDSVTEIGIYVFENTAYYNNESNWENSLLYIGNHLIKAKEDISGNFEIKQGTKTIADTAFENCTSLTSITIPDSVTSIGRVTFIGCKSLTSVTIPNSVTSIGEGAFTGCTSLTSVTIPDSVTSIGWYAFEDCTSLTSITIPDSVTSIDTWAFRACTSLTSITIPDSVTEIKDGAFENTAYYNNESNWENSLLYIGNHLIKAKEDISGNFEIKQGTKTIADTAFENCTSLTSITIPDSVTSIGRVTFSGCKSLTSVTIPNSVTSIGYAAFNGCTSLTSITIPDSVTEIEIYAFGNTAYYNNESNWENSLLYIGNHLIKAKEDVSGNFEIKQGTKTIADCAFKDCTSLTSITIPDSVTEIGEVAFGYYYDSIEDEWKTVDGFTIYGNRGSKAERYANENGFKFVAIGDAPTMTFPDVASNDWYFNAVKFNTEKGYVTGYSNGTFGPSNNIQRQDFVLILARIAGADLSAYEGQNGGFSDVQTGSYYASAVAWAKDTDVANGFSADNFGVGTYITREQISLILCRYLNGSASGNVDAILNAYSDGGNTSPWAKAGVAWAVENGIIGNSDYLNPNGNAGRAEVAQIIYNMSNKGML